VELRVGDEKEAYLYCICCKIKNWTQGGKQVIHLDQDVKCIEIVDGKWWMETAFVRSLSLCKSF
jgi:hypothetical protein